MTTVTREHRAEARDGEQNMDTKQELIEFLMRDGYVDMDILRRVFEVLGRAVGDRNQALADRDARIGELERLRVKCTCWRVDYSDGMCVDCWDPTCTLCGGDGYLMPATETKAQLARVVGALDELLGAEGCSCDCGHDSDGHEDECERCFACRVDQILKEAR